MGQASPPSVPIMTSVQTKRMTRDYAIAVQPKAWGRFDPHGCDWATSMDHAHRLCSVWLAKYHYEDMVIWKVPASGKAMAWMSISADMDAIASMVCQ